MAEINDWKEVPIDDWREVPVSAPAPEVPLMDRIKSGAKTFSDIVNTPMDVTANLVTGALAAPISKIGGALTAAWEGGVKGNPNWGKAAQETENQLSSLYTYKPTNKIAETASNAVGGLMSLPFYPAAKAGEYLTEKGYPNAGYLTKTAGEYGTMMAAPAVYKKIAGAEMFNPSEAGLNKVIKGAVEQGVNKGVAPSVSGQRTAVQRAQFMDRAEQGVRAIVENKGNLNLTGKNGEIVTGQVPTTNAQFSEAISQTKQKIFSEYDGMKSQAEGAGVTLDTTGLVNELKALGNDPAIIRHAPEVAQRAMQLAEDYASAELRPAQAQREIAILNSKTQAFHKNPNPQSASMAVLDNLAANNLRKSLDSTIETEVGPGYQALKNKYGALRAIEEEVAKRTVVDARKRPQGFFDISNIFTGAEAAKALASLSPANAAAAGTMYAIKAWIKRENNPNTHIARMFKTVDSAMKKMPKQAPPSESMGPLDRGYYERNFGIPVGEPQNVPYREPYRGVMPGQELVPYSSPAPYTPSAMNNRLGLDRGIELLRRQAESKRTQQASTNLPRSRVVYKNESTDIAPKRRYREQIYVKGD